MLPLSEEPTGLPGGRLGGWVRVILKLNTSVVICIPQDYICDALTETPHPNYRGSEKGKVWNLQDMNGLVSVSV